MTSRNLELFKNIASGKDSIEKLAYSAMDRKTLNKQISRVQKELSKARKDYVGTASELKGLEVKMVAAKELLEKYTSELIQLNDLSTRLDLSGADSISPQGNEYAFMIDGKRMHIDSSDVNDVKVIPWKEYIRSKKNTTDESESDDLSDDDFFDIQKDDSTENFNDIFAGLEKENKYITKIAKKFR